MDTTAPARPSNPPQHAPGPGASSNAHLIVGGSPTAGLPMTTLLSPVLPGHTDQDWLARQA